MTHLRCTAGLLVALFGFSIAGCGGGTINAQSRAPGQAPYSAPPRQTNTGMSTRNKVLLLAGAAALYYLYQRHKNAQGEGPQGRYYRSKNGRVYYRDLKTGAFHWVDPPQQPIRVPAEEYQRYTGRSIDDYNGGVIRQAPPGW
ncbi:MAG TPA: hypothetical protein VFU47_02555 [Armatimonadota bacterium]|nr:hypothetical protein [Armatimonadota bacterium]